MWISNRSLHVNKEKLLIDKFSLLACLCVSAVWKLEEIKIKIVGCLHCTDVYEIWNIHALLWYDFIKYQLTVLVKIFVFLSNFLNETMTYYFKQKNKLLLEKNLNF